VARVEVASPGARAESNVYRKDQAAEPSAATRPIPTAPTVRCVPVTPIAAVVLNRLTFASVVAVSTWRGAHVLGRSSSHQGPRGIRG
jgi:hypothetical protein